MFRPFIVVILAAAVTGIFLSADLTYVHYKTFTDMDYQSFCALSDAWNCQTVAISEYSVFWKLPVSLWGFIVYLVYVFVTLITWVDFRKKRKDGARGLGIVFGMGVIGAVVSAILYYICYAIIQSKCILCVGLYIINAIIFLSVAVYAFYRKESPLKWILIDIRGILLKPGLPLYGLGAAAVVVMALEIFYPRLYIEHVNCEHYNSPSDSSRTCDEEATYGSSSAVVMITEFSDYECPYCAYTHFTLRKAVDAFPGKVMLKHRHFPLDISCNPLLKRPFHRDACLAAKASVCAGKQSSFWKFNDLLWRNRKHLEKEDMLEYARKTDLDVGKFIKCLEHKSTLDEVKRDIKEAANTSFVQSGMVGTPIIYIGDHPHIGGIGYDELVKIIQEQIAANAKN